MHSVREGALKLYPQLILVYTRLESPTAMTTISALPPHLSGASPHMSDALALVAADPDFRILRRLPHPLVLPSEPLEDPALLVALDTEATGTNPQSDELLELGMVKAQYCRATGRLGRIVSRFNQLRDPGIPIPPEASRVNHITSETVAGHQISFEEATAFLEDVSLVVAHNAPFDRVLCERYLPITQSKAWACSLRDIDWLDFGLPGGKLEFIAMSQGWFYSGHRAEVDCEALLQCLTYRQQGGANGSAFSALLKAARTPKYRVFAYGAAFQKKDVLSVRYSWFPGSDGQEKAWYVDVDADALPAELNWLKEAVYGGRSCSPGVAKVTAAVRHSNRPLVVQREFL